MKQYRRVRYHKRQPKPTYTWHPLRSTKGSLITLAIIMAIIIYWGNLNSNLAHARGMADMASNIIARKDTQTQQLALQIEHQANDNQALKKQLEFSANLKVDDKTRAIVETYIQQYFGNETPIVERIVKCESNFSPMALNDRNANGSQDRGVFQINSVHATQFKQVTGYDYNLMSHDAEQNIKFAKWVWDNSGPSAWVCSKIVGI